MPIKFSLLHYLPSYFIWFRMLARIVLPPQQQNRSNPFFSGYEPLKQLGCCCEFSLLASDKMRGVTGANGSESSLAASLHSMSPAQQ